MIFHPPILSHWQLESKVVGIYTSGTTMLSNAITVTVLNCSLPADPAVMVGIPRNWQMPVFSNSVILDAATGLTVTSVASSTNTMCNFQLSLVGQNDYLLAARVGAGGAVIGTTTVHGLNFYQGVQTYNQVLQVYPDGSKLVEMLLVMSDFPPGVTIQLNIFVAGVTFEDGTTSKTLTADDFDAQGCCKVRFIKAKSVSTSNCHNTHIYQNGVLIDSL